MLRPALHLSSASTAPSESWRKRTPGFPAPGRQELSLTSSASAAPAWKKGETMSDHTHLAGKVMTLWRYPIKSMLGEELHVATLVNGSLLGDRALALIDGETGSVASAKHPGRWSRLLACQAAFVEPPVVGEALPVVRVTLPDGTTLLSGQHDCNRRVSQALGRFDVR